MRVLYSNKDEISFRSDVLILPLLKRAKTPAFSEVDQALDGLLNKVLGKKPSLSDFKKTEFIHIMDDKSVKGILIIGLGIAQKVEPEMLRMAGGVALNAIRDYKVKEAFLSVRDFGHNNLDYEHFVEGFLLGNYRFIRYKSKPQKIYLKRLTILKRKTQKDMRRLHWLLHVTDAVCFVRDLVNSPSNEVTPSTIAGIARRMTGGKLKIKILGSKEITRQGLNAFYSVGKGSEEEPRFIILEYSGGKGPPIAIVGKSVTFDSGGISLKPSAGMGKMKYDMAGGAVVLGVLRAVSKLKLPVRIVGIIPACENLPSGTSSKPGDVVRSFSGKTVEIVNTDAEGRLLLADAIEYSKKYKPKVIIDMATLTGACSVALGNEAIALMGNDEKYLGSLKRASQSSGESVWQMPLYNQYAEYIKSDVADLKNTGGRSGSLVTAGYFLKEFAGHTPWVHLDIASTAWTDKDRAYVPKGATGVGVRLIMELLKEVLD